MKLSKLNMKPKFGPEKKKRLLRESARLQDQKVKIRERVHQLREVIATLSASAAKITQGMAPSTRVRSCLISSTGKLRDDRNLASIGIAGDKT